MGIGPTTSSLPRKCSTNELRGRENVLQRRWPVLAPLENSTRRQPRPYGQISPTLLSQATVCGSPLAMVTEFSPRMRRVSESSKIGLGFTMSAS